jgi:hypothetical protein
MPAGQARAKLDVNRVLTAASRLPVHGGPLAVEGWLPRLCLAILEDALLSLGARGRRQHEAWEWVRSDAEYCFSFAWVCAVLHLDAEAVRRQLLL